jgi:1,2-diacylglycerol 3-beta-galactosyltransferase
MTSNRTGPVPLLFLVGDTGGGHRSAAQAVGQALDRAFPGRFATVICDPLRGDGAPLRLRWLMSLYAPGIRLTPWLWGMLWRGVSSPRALRWARRTLLSPAYRSVADAVAANQPALIVAFHPMTAVPAVRARDRGAPGALVITVITDLVSAHLWWRDAAVDRVIVPSAPIGRSCALGGMPEGRWVEIGLPVAAGFSGDPLRPGERHALRRSLGVDGQRFLVVLTGGAEGSGGIYRRAAALLRHAGDVDVAVICGRNRVLQRRLARLARRERSRDSRARPGQPERSRLTVRGFVDNMPDWMRCADVVAGKAGPGTIAEAACCAAALLLTSHVPGQEEGNIEFVVSAGAGRYAPRPRDLVAEVRRLLRDPAALAAMRAAAAGLSRPSAAADIAGLLAALAGQALPGTGTRAGQPRAGQPRAGQPG